MTSSLCNPGVDKKPARSNRRRDLPAQESAACAADAAGDPSPQVAKERSRRVHDDGLESRLRAALLARYGDLAELRYDFPLVLISGDGGEILLRPLSEIVDGLLQAVAPSGTEGERLRQQVLVLEREIRALSLDGGAGRLSQLWQSAERNLLSRVEEPARAAFEESFARARGALTLDGEVIGCDGETPGGVLTHVWNAVETVRAQRFRARIEQLILRLSELLQADFMKSAEAHAPARLAHAFGGAFENAFDFEAMARILDAAPHGTPSPQSRQNRIRTALEVLGTQRFAPCSEGIDPYRFTFDHCGEALEAFRQRLPQMAEVIKAMTIAELELANGYREPVHDAFFARFDENALEPDDLARFPSYLVHVRESVDDIATAEIAEALSTGLPLKIVLQRDDILPERPVASGKFMLGGDGSRLAGLAVGLNRVFVVQACNSHLYAMREPILEGMRYEGAALFGVFSGCGAGTAGIPPYLAAAAALESRAFPAFSYDPAAGHDLAARFNIGGNPQAQAAWPVHRLDYEDEDHQSISERLAFTFADFAACDRRYAKHSVAVPRTDWNERMVPVADYLQDDATAGQLPYIPLIDDDNILRRHAVDDTLIRATRGCLDAWQELQELAGYNRLRETAPAAAAAPEPNEPTAPDSAAQVSLEVQETAVQEPAAEKPEVEEPAESSSDAPYIETPRCTTCEECILVNSRMFAYDENQQAYIADPAAGTYRELVEAAERCQVSIIHPGKPSNTDEPDLDELMERAAPFQS